MGGNDTTIGLSYQTRDMLKDFKIITEETYDGVIVRLTKQLEEDECILDQIKTILMNGKDEKGIVEEIKKVLGVK